MSAVGTLASRGLAPLVRSNARPVIANGSGRQSPGCTLAERRRCVALAARRQPGMMPKEPRAMPKWLDPDYNKWSDPKLLRSQARMAFTPQTATPIKGIRSLKLLDVAHITMREGGSRALAGKSAGLREGARGMISNRLPVGACLMSVGGGGGGGDAVGGAVGGDDSVGGSGGDDKQDDQDTKPLIAGAHNKPANMLRMVYVAVVFMFRAIQSSALKLLAASKRSEMAKVEEEFGSILKRMDMGELEAWEVLLWGKVVEVSQKVQRGAAFGLQLAHAGAAVMLCFIYYDWRSVASRALGARFQQLLATPLGALKAQTAVGLFTVGAIASLAVSVLGTARELQDNKRDYKKLRLLLALVSKQRRLTPTLLLPPFS